MIARSRKWRRHRPPLHWKCGVSARKRWHRIRRLWRSDREIEECNYFGAKFQVVRNDVIGAEMILKRYEWSQIPRMIRACRELKPAAFVDVGANFGLYTCIIGKLQLADRLIAFEPDRRAFALLQKHLASNGLTAVESHELAVGASRSSAVLVPAMGTNSGISTVVAAHPEGYEIEVAALDDMLSFAGKPLAIKIDVEGYEQPVLEGAKRLFAQNYGYAQIEVLDERDDSVIVKMTQLGWELHDRINSDFVFWRRAT